MLITGKNISTVLAISMILVVASGFGSAALAQTDESAEPTGVLEEVIVTAQRREQTRLEIPAALSVVTGEDIRDNLLRTSHALELSVPGLTFHEVSGSSQVTLRGVGTGYAGPALGNSVAIYTDDSYVSNQIGAVEVFYDMDRVEVLKGPQPTLYGRNATGGTIQFITNKPSLDEPAGYVEFGLAELDTVEFEGMLNQPLGESWALRVAGKSWDRHEGHVTNINNGDKITGENDHKRLRAQLLFQPSDVFKAIFKYEYGRTEGDEPLRRQNATGDLCLLCVGGDDGNALGWYETDQTPQIEVDQGVVDAWGYNPMAGNSHGRYREVDVFALNMDWAINDTLTLISTTQHRKVTQNGGQDQDANFPGMQSAFSAKRDDGPDGIIYKSLTQEFRLVSDSESRINYTAGVAYSDDDNQFAFGVGGDAWNPLMATAYNFDDVTSWSVYVEAYIDITDSLNLTIGGRYTDDEVTHAVLGGSLAGNPLPRVSQTEDFDEFTPRIALNYRADWGSTYASFSQGFKAGGFNSPSFGLQPRIEPEEIDAYEIGAKLTPRDNIHIDLALFHYDWDNLQVAIIDTGSLGISQENAAKAELDGFEAAIRWVVNEMVSMGLAYTYLDGEYRNYDNASCFIPAWTAVDPDGNIIDPDAKGLTRSICNFTGTSLAHAPENAFAADMAFAFPVGDTWTGRFNALASYTDDYDMIPGAGGPARLTVQPEHTVVNLSLTVENDSGLSLQLYVDNATDEDYLFESQTTNWGGYQGVNYPRIFGVRARHTW